MIKNLHFYIDICTVTVIKFARELKELGVGIFLKNRTLTLYQGTVI